MSIEYSVNISGMTINRIRSSTEDPELYVSASWSVQAQSWLASARRVSQPHHPRRLCALSLRLFLMHLIGFLLSHHHGRIAPKMPFFEQ